MAERETLRLSWDVPLEERADVLVVGGGSAGIAAATAAARNGARTVLVERYGFLGGTSTAGLVGPFMTSYSADGKEPVVGGIFQEVVDRMAATGGAIDPGKTEGGEKWAAYIKLGHAHVTPVHPEALKVAAMETVVEAGVKLMLHTAFVDVVRADRPASGDRLEGIVVLTKAGLHALPATVLIDCSADADVAVRAGVPVQLGRESDGRMMPATMFFRIGSVDDERVEAFAREHETLHPASASTSASSRRRAGAASSRCHASTSTSTASPSRACGGPTSRACTTSTAPTPRTSRGPRWRAGARS